MIWNEGFAHSISLNGEIIYSRIFTFPHRCAFRQLPPYFHVCSCLSFAVVLSFVWIVLMRFFAEIIVWSTLTLFVILFSLCKWFFFLSPQLYTHICTNLCTNLVLSELWWKKAVWEKGNVWLELTILVNSSRRLIHIPNCPPSSVGCFPVQSRPFSTKVHLQRLRMQLLLQSPLNRKPRSPRFTWSLVLFHLKILKIFLIYHNY